MVAFILGLISLAMYAWFVFTILIPFLRRTVGV